MQRFGKIRRAHFAGDQAERQIMLSAHMFGFRRPPPPVERLGWIARHAFAFDIERAQIERRTRIASVRERAPDGARVLETRFFIGCEPVGEILRRGVPGHACQGCGQKQCS